MSPFARFPDALTLCGVGLLMWFGLGWPKVNEGAVYVATAIILALVLAAPLFEMIANRAGVLVRLQDRFGTLPLYLSTSTLVLLAPYVWSMERLNRYEKLGYLITLLGFAALALYGFHRAGRIERRGFGRIFSAILLIGYAGVGGALLAGQAQFSILAVSALGLVQLFDWFVFNRLQGKLWGGVFAFILPLFMLVSLQIGHGLAIPLIASYVAGVALILRSEEAISRAQ